MDRMSPLDSGFWHLENRHASLHIASTAVFEGPPPTYAEMVRLFQHKLPLIPRYRQKMRRVPLDLGRPVWVDDRDFDLTYHLRRTAVPTPGSDEQLRRLVGRLMSQRLDPDKPLWESWIVEGLDEGRWALISKIHHSMADGLAGMDVLSRLLDTSPDAELPPVADWEPVPEPGILGLVSGAAIDRMAATGRVARGLASAAVQPVRTAKIAAVGLRGLLTYAGAVRPITSTSLSGPLGAARRYRWVSVDLADVLEVRRALGGSINDVVLAIVTHGFRELLRSRDEAPDPHAVRCLVPVSVRKPVDAGRIDNRVSALLPELPVEFADPVVAYRAVAARMRELKSSPEAPAGELLTELAEFVPPPILDAVLHAAFRMPQRALTTVATNVPGPRQQLYALGRRMLTNYPYVPIADRIRVGIAVTSYDDRLFFGITSDRDSVPDVDVLTGGIVDGLAELVKVADATKQEG